MLTVNNLNVLDYENIICCSFYIGRTKWNMYIKDRDYHVC